MHITKIYGGAGTGKTTYLKSIIEKELENGINPSEIFFGSFSKSAVNEMKNRLNLTKPVNEQHDLSSFRTIHSLAFNALSLKMDSMHIPNKQRNTYLLDKFHTVFSYVYNTKKTGENFNKVKFLTLIKKMNIKMFSYSSYKALEKRYLQFLHATSKMDFNTLIETYLRNNEFQRFKVLVIDEAQDLTPALFQVVEKLIGKQPERVYLAGDDDQTIYSFSGAVPNLFIDIKANEEIILKTNYRNPQTHLDLANKVLDKIKVRVKKDITAVNKEEYSYDTVEEKVVKNLNKCKELNYIYLPRFETHNGIYLPRHEYETTCVLFRFKNDALEYQKYLQRMGRSFFTIDGTLSINTSRFNLKRKTHEQPTISISTIHKAKGKEYDNVVYYHTPYTPRNKAVVFSDAELRVMYVALTRAKKRLTIVDNNDSFNFL